MRARGLLAARDSGARERHEGEARHAARVRDLFPLARLVDERLADVEHECLHSHDATLARSSDVVTLSRRGSPGTTLTRPPAASTDPAQSLAAVSPASARRSSSVGK